MRTIKVKEGRSKYKLQSEKGGFIGELVIDFNPSQKVCHINISKKAKSMQTLSIGRR